MTGTWSLWAAWLALVLWLVGLALAFGLQTWRLWRAGGTTGYRGISGRPGSLAWWGGVLFPAALLATAAGPLLAVTGVAPPIRPLTTPWLAATGLGLALAGLAVVLAAQAAMGTSWRIGVDERERTALVTRGLFGRLRNPVFTGMVAVTAGIALMVPTVVALLALGCLIAAAQIQVRVVEEPYLHRVHGESYGGYLDRTGRFLPRLRRRGVGGERPAAG